ncbi:MAG: DUF4405 domain-containing protein [Deltaproteobacteria bacterium]|uniref:DUF4405 domain-containing protein n=1 Tax=Candidatus Zymogenus saltonus TaxID=2844893 RepID=A0A9D8KEB2_9DELT|nr:DUF4405 domain-containing protein [Candidatus Zymogenus saltonus]
MKKGRYNFVVDTILAFLFMMMVSTGILMHLFPKGLGRTTALGLTRHEWGDIHLTISLLFLVFILVHFILHYNWEKVTAMRFLKIGGKTLAISVLLLFVVALSLPFFITKDLPDERGYGYRSGKYIIPKEEGEIKGTDGYLNDTLYDAEGNSGLKYRNRGASK